MIRYLDVVDLLELAKRLGVGPVRDVGLLASAAARVSSTVFGEDAYPTLNEKAAVLLESILQNHALVDGNKRLAWLSFVVFLSINGVVLDVEDDDAYDMIIDLTTKKIDRNQAMEWLAQHS